MLNAVGERMACSISSRNVCSGFSWSASYHLIALRVPIASLAFIGNSSSFQGYRTFSTKRTRVRRRCRSVRIDSSLASIWWRLGETGTRPQGDESPPRKGWVRCYLSAGSPSRGSLIFRRSAKARFQSIAHLVMSFSRDRETAQKEYTGRHHECGDTAVDEHQACLHIR
jgi:hypothetical protein